MLYSIQNFKELFFFVPHKKSAPLFPMLTLPGFSSMYPADFKRGL
jgi:hypothetical protein